MNQSQTKLLILLDEKKKIEKKLNSIVFGSIEIRNREQKQYLYVHYREDGILITKYVGEYTKELHEVILKNNIESKELKKQLKHIYKQLKFLNYSEIDLDEKVKRNIDFARRNLVDTIYKQSILEGIATTYMDTETIIEGGKVTNMSPNDILKIVNLKHAWEFILNKNVISSPSNFVLLSEINKLIEEGFYYNAGSIRNIPVSIGGTTWKPSIPIETQVKEELSFLLEENLDIVDKAIDILLYVMKRQIFIDGNKRTAVIFANHLLISNSSGLIVIPVELVEEFKKYLINYYEGNDIEGIKRFLKTKCYIEI